MVKEGDRIRVKSLHEGDPSISPGDEGTVDFINDSQFAGSQIFVDFDNGSNLALLPEDNFEILED